MSIAIKVENLSKKYIIGHQKQEKYTALRDVIANGAKSLGQRILHPISGKPIREEASYEEFWALDDVSFEIRHGERVGIIGRNGAGKSTLLKILSRITEPSSGRVSINGRVASLLEVGTGFHPELTGRENIYLNGAILGMSRAEIRRKFDEIVDFSEVEKFLDTPVKRYSSGMYVRLAFAVAAHLEPEILVVDEVLAVGDAQFQKKCLGKMEGVAKEGRTVLFVSHNMAAVTALCTSGILLNRGKIACLGLAKDIVNAYLEEPGTKGHNKLHWIATDNGYPFADVIRIRDFRILDGLDNVSENQLFTSDVYFFSITTDIKKPDKDIRIAFAIYSREHELIMTSSASDNGKIIFSDLMPGRYTFHVPFPTELFNEDCYYIEILCVIENRGWILPVGNDSRLKFIVIRDKSSNPNMIHRLGGVTAPFSPVLDWGIQN